MRISDWSSDVCSSDLRIDPVLLPFLLALYMFGIGKEHREVLETYRIIARDAGWIGRIREAIVGGLTAEAAVQRVRDDTRARMAGVEDPYIRERLADFEDVALRLLQHLSPETAAGHDAEPAGDWILIARSLGPAEILAYDRTSLKGLALEEGSESRRVRKECVSTCRSRGSLCNKKKQRTSIYRNVD